MLQINIPEWNRCCELMLRETHAMSSMSVKQAGNVTRVAHSN